jgi:hypothetical protein
MTFDGSGTITGLAAGGLPNSSVITADIADAAITAAKLDGAQSGSAPIYGARAWVNFNGTGTVAIRASGNVSSITDNGAGDYSVNFTTAMPDENYALTGAGGNDGEIFSNRGFTSFPPTTTAVRVAVTDAAGTRLDSTGVTLAIFR